jgi:glycosyltransferase involved in cell wall biosynthesis
MSVNSSEIGGNVFISDTIKDLDDDVPLIGARERLEDGRLSTVMRFHNRERLPLLEEALFSLANQFWHDHETIVVVQNGDQEIEKIISDMIISQPWSSTPCYKVLSVAIPKGVDGRSTLLNRGIQEATGRYLAFLDDDDVVYQHGYEVLVKQLKETDAAVAVGGCKMARTQYVSGHWFIQTKEDPFSWGRNRRDLLRDNFVPIHSYVVDRKRVESQELYFDDEMPPLEDYEFLLRLCSKHEFDFSNLDTPVCEYRIHELNSLPYTAGAPPESRTKHIRAQNLINERKSKINCLLPVSELLDLEQQKAVLQARVVELELEKQREQERFLNTVTLKIYNFFGRFQWLERQLSKTTHGAWNGYRKVKAGLKRI